KRAFDATPEPAPAMAAAGEGPLLFVVQRHSARRLHYDLRLECDGVLLSWAVPKGPSLDRIEKRLAVQTEDHPYDYASFEGVIPPGQYGAGEVIVWDCGVYSPDEGGTAFGDRAEAERRVREDLARGKLGFQLRGEKLKGSFALVKTREAKQWLLIKHADRFVTTADITARDRSVLSGMAVEDLKAMPARRIPASQLVPTGRARPMPAKLAPMLADTAPAPFDRAGWSWEPKLDGYRVLAFIGPEGVRLRSRRGLELSGDFPRLAAELAGQGAPMILDGEIVAFDAAGRPSFAALQARAQGKTEREIAAADRDTPVVLYCFDLLHFAGIDLVQAPQRDRRRYLAQCLLPSPLLRLVHASDRGVELHAAALATGFEGVVGKRADSRYEPGRRSPSWRKVKPVHSADFVVGGYTRGKGPRAPLGSLLVGYWERGKLRFASHVGSGFDDAGVKAVRARLEPLAREECPFSEVPERNGPTTWVEPTAVAEVAFQGWTGDGHLRAPVFLRMRDDVDPRKVRRAARAVVAAAPGTPGGRAIAASPIEEVVAQLEGTRKEMTLAVGAHRIRLTHLDRVYWPENAALRQPAVTKRDLLRYYAQVSPFMLPHLADRPLTMIRMPGGIDGQRFFQKHWEQERPEFVEAITVFSGHKDERHEYLLCNNLPTLLWLAQSGTLELHVWHSRARPGADAAAHGTDYAGSLASLEASVLNYPDYVLFDIDPYIYSGREAKGAEPELNT
ncbi:MAG TPA: non-homologous end-joining DNA ligase, partial [Myxococcota bacterium]|nr:non-homologous end-joining DNA ligase [Myxococcota bacterium]